MGRRGTVSRRPRDHWSHSRQTEEGWWKHTCACGKVWSRKTFKETTELWNRHALHQAR